MDIIKKKDGFRNERHIIFPSNINDFIKESPLVDHTYILEIGYYPNAKYHYRERINGVDEFVLIYCLEGQGTIEIPDSVISMSRGDIFCIPKKVAHRYYANENDPWSILWMHFHTNLDHFLGLHKKLVIKVLAKERYIILQGHFIDIFELAGNVNSDEMITCTSQLLRLVLSEIFFLADGSISHQKNLYLAKCISYMSENIDQDINLAEFAKHLEISSSYLNSLFKNYTNKSPIEYFIEMRIEQACKYLKLSNLKIYEIAKKVGYQDPYYFSRLFKKNTGYSPKDYRVKFSKNVHDSLKKT